ncbi:MAG: Hvo_1808 family surface protein, partial [Halobacteriaceae archaeon]
ELRAFVARSMARVEYIRRLEFKRRVPVTVMSREEYGGDGKGNDSAEISAYAKWNNQVWEALFIVGETKNVQDELQQTRSASVAGFYSIGSNQIVIITPNVSSPTISNGTLIHELTHALQDQYVNLSSPQFSARTQDGSLAIDGLIEGEANYVEQKYSMRCGNEWSCISPPQRPNSGGSTNINLGIFLTIFQPYSDGPVYVHRLVQDQGWASLDYSSPPNSSEQIIHVTRDPPLNVSIRDIARNGWKPFDLGTDTVGEASIFAMFWYQSRNSQANIIDWRRISQVQSQYDTYDYSSAPSAGWGGDAILPYHRQSNGTQQYGYIWRTQWDTRRDAEEFHSAYLSIL